MPASEPAQFQAASDCSLAVRFGRQITFEAHRSVRRLVQLLQSEPIPGIRNLHPAYCSLLITFDPLRMAHEQLQAALEPRLLQLGSVPLPEPQEIEIPVCYGGEHGPDLPDVAARHGLTPERVIELHAAAEYLVYFLGFVPGFAYLGGLAAELATPRLPTPRRDVPRGSVGIAGSQTGVYPFATPGGWRLIGRTPVALFLPEREPMSLLSIGDRVRFVPIPPRRFAELERTWR